MPLGRMISMGNNILNPLEKEMLIKIYKSNPGVKIRDFCDANNVSDTAFKSWLKKYEEEGIEGLYRSKKHPPLLPDGLDESAENYKREVIKLRIELERLKKNYSATTNQDGEVTGYITLRDKNTKS